MTRAQAAPVACRHTMKHRDPDNGYQSPWLRHLILLWTALMMVGTVIAAAYVIFIHPLDKGKRINCDMTQWHPDTAVKVREECRKRRL